MERNDKVYLEIEISRINLPSANNPKNGNVRGLFDLDNAFVHIGKRDYNLGEMLRRVAKLLEEN